MERLIVGTDLSARSDRAVQRALNLAHHLGVQLAIVHVVDDSMPTSVVEEQETFARRAIEAQLAAQQFAAEFAPDVRVVRGQDFTKLAGLDHEVDGDLVVLGEHRHTIIDLFRGTTVERVIRFGDRPVLVVKSTVIAPYQKVLVAADTSLHAKAALQLAARIAPQSRIEILHACQDSFAGFLNVRDRESIVAGQQEAVRSWLQPDVDALTRDLGSSSPSFEFAFGIGATMDVIRQHAFDVQPDLIALGTHARSGLARAVLGSITEHLLAESNMDVLAVKAGGLA